METIKINGKAIYSPKGKAGEYAKYAVNFYVGCSNDCEYCYCKRGILGHAMGAPIATLKKCFKDETDALKVFQKEVQKNLMALRRYGLFFSFSTDPMLAECRKLTISAVDFAVSYGIPCKILTKRADFINDIPGTWLVDNWYRERIAFGFTLTGHDEIEPNASSNFDRVSAMEDLAIYGFRTFASIEPVISIKESTEIIIDALHTCELFKIGLLSGNKEYTPEQILKFIDDINAILAPCSNDPKVYYKDSVLQFVKLTREELHERAQKQGNDFVLVDSNYSLFQL